MWIKNFRIASLRISIHHYGGFGYGGWDFILNRVVNRMSKIIFRKRFFMCNN